MLMDRPSLDVFDYTLARVQGEIDALLLTDEQERGSLVPVSQRLANLRQAIVGYTMNNQSLTIGEVTAYMKCVVELEDKLEALLLKG